MIYDELELFELFLDAANFCKIKSLQANMQNSAYLTSLK